MSKRMPRRLRRLYVINGNGFGYLDESRIGALMGSSVSARGMADAVRPLNRAVERLQRFLDSCPEDVFFLYGSAVAEIGERLSDLAGEIGSAHDRVLGFVDGPSVSECDRCGGLFAADGDRECFDCRGGAA